MTTTTSDVCDLIADMVEAPTVRDRERIASALGTELERLVSGAGSTLASALQLASRHRYAGRSPIMFDDDGRPTRVGIAR